MPPRTTRVYEMPVIAPGVARGSRGPHAPAATRPRKSAMNALTRSGSSRFSVCPDFGRTARPLRGTTRFSHRLVSRQPSSLVAREDQHGRFDRGQLRFQRVQRRPFPLHAAHRAHGSLRGVLAQLAHELLPPPRVLVPELHPRRPGQVLPGEGLGFPTPRSAGRWPRTPCESAPPPRDAPRSRFPRPPAIEPARDAASPDAARRSRPWRCR